MTEIHGVCEPEFGAVRDAFAGNFARGLEVGASVCVTHHGRTVVDLWAGDADTNGRPWERDTIVNVWSTTKTMAAICMLMAADRGLIDLEAPVAEYWPEFGANGKTNVLVRHVLAHTAGLPGWDPAITGDDIDNWDKVTSILAAQATWWEPGTRSGYHALSQGYLEGEIIRRVTGRTIGRYFAHEVAGPLGADFHIGLPESEEPRVGQMIVPPRAAHTVNPLTGMPISELARRAAESYEFDLELCNTRRWRAAEIPAAGGTGNARSVGRVHSVLACGGSLDGVSLLSETMLDRILEEQYSGEDPVLGLPMRYGIGFGLFGDAMPLSPNPRTFFWGGLGGSISVIDRDAQFTVSYVMNNMATGMDLRGASVIFAAYGALTALG